MSNTLVPHSPDDDDGFGGGRSGRGAYIRWSAEQGWTDRDGLPPPPEMLVPAVREILQRWKDNKPETIVALPLPDPDVLNAAIPVKEWEKGLDGKPRPPWAHCAQVFLIDPATGAAFTFTSPTAGGHIAFNLLRDQVANMRVLRGARVMPLVRLAERPMKTQFGLKSRPHFEIIDWKAPGDPTALPTEPAPQLPKATAPAPAPEPEPPTPPAAPEPAPAPAPPTGSRRKPRMKSPIRLGEETMVAMGKVEPVTMGEIIDDSLPFDDPIPFGG